jgi:hypothetical protein
VKCAHRQFCYQNRSPRDAHVLLALDLGGLGPGWSLAGCIPAVATWLGRAQPLALVDSSPTIRARKLRHSRYARPTRRHVARAGRRVIVVVSGPCNKL